MLKQNRVYLKIIAMTTTNNYLTQRENLAIQPISISLGAARFSFLFAFVSLLLIAVLHIVKSELAPAGHMLSEYAIGEYGWIMQFSFFSWAASCIAVAVSIRSQIATSGGKIGLVLLAVTGIALIMGGIFIIDSPYAEKNEPTTHGSLHGLSAMIGLPCQAIASLLISYSLKRNRHWLFATRTIILFAHLIWISLVLLFASTFIMMSMSQGKFSAVTAIGWFNRLLVLACCGWLMVIASKAIQANRHFMTKTH